MYSPDGLDRDIMRLFARNPRIGVLGASRALGIARGTVQARLDRLEAAGVLTSWAPTIDPAALGFPVSAFATLEISQRKGHNPVAEHLRAIPEVLEAHTITGAADLMVRLVARCNADLRRVIDRGVGWPGVRRRATGRRAG